MFKRYNQPETVSASDVEALQYAASDPKTVAEQRTAEFRRQSLIDRVHPWDADDRVQARLAFYAIATINDVIAESMMASTMTTDKNGATILPRKVEMFVREASERAHQMADAAEAGDVVDGDSFAFDDDTRQMLGIGNNLPTFPEYEFGIEKDMPYGRNIERGKVDAGFVDALNGAAVVIRGKADDLAAELERFPETAPSRYRLLLTTIRQEFLYDSLNAYDEAQRQRELDTDIALADAYESSYRGLLQGAIAYQVLHSPGLLNEAWLQDSND